MEKAFLFGKLLNVMLLNIIACVKVQPSSFASGHVNT